MKPSQDTPRTPAMRAQLDGEFPRSREAQRATRSPEGCAQRTVRDRVEETSRHHRRHAGPQSASALHKARANFWAPQWRPEIRPTRTKSRRQPPGSTMRAGASGGRAGRASQRSPGPSQPSPQAPNATASGVSAKARPSAARSRHPSRRTHQAKGRSRDPPARPPLAPPRTS
jgi:hypothetical protein